VGLFNFGKKGKKDASASNVVKKGKAPKKGKHQKKAPLSYTALEPFVDSLYGENGFRHDYEGEQLGVVLVLPFSEIGGLSISKEDKRNQSKGVFVTSINKGDFEVYYDEKLDEAEQIVILANTDSIDTLADFSIVKDAEFRWAYFTKDGELIETDYVSTLDELVENRLDLKNYFGSIFEEDEDEVEDVKDESMVSQINDELKELNQLSGLSANSDNNFVEQLENVNDDVIENHVEPVDEPKFEPIAEVDSNIDENADLDNNFAEPDFGGDNEDYAYDEDIDYGNDGSLDYSDDDTLEFDDDLMYDNETVDDHKVDEVVNQILFKNDLDLELPIDRFREIYLASSDNLMIPYYEDDGSWLTQEANRLIHEANDDIRRKVLSDGDVAHATYVRLLNELAIKTSNLFDLNGDNEYSRLISNVNDIKADEQVLTTSDVEAYIAKRNEEYNDRREAKGNEAKVNAMNTYDSQHREKHDRQMYEYKRLELQEVDRRYNDRVVEIKKERSSSAQTYFDTGVAKVLSELGEYYINIRKSQSDYANQWGDKLLQFLDDNRANDVARIEVMERQLAYDERVERLEKESSAEIQRLKDNFDTEIDLLKVAKETAIDSANKLVESLKEEKASLQNRLDSFTETASSEYRELMNKYLDITQDLAQAKTTVSMFEAQKLQLEQRDREIENWKSQVEIVAKANDRNKVAFFCISVVAVVAALLVGMIAGAQLF
jgi:hypothetical protein